VSEAGGGPFHRFLCDLTPPILLRGLRKLRARRRPGPVVPPASAAEGREQGPAWYDQIYERPLDYHEHYTRSRYYFLWVVVADRILRAGGRSVLDLGCGPGQFAALLRDKGVLGYLGLDFSDGAIALARSACPEFRFDVADIIASPVLNEDPYDVVVGLEFLEHVEADRGVLRRIRSGASFYGTVPNFPDPAHVRYFENTEAVRARYTEFFTGFEVEPFLADDDGQGFFLLQGVRR